MRYARNLAQGHGLIWNPGGDVAEGYSNFLWTLWMSFLHVVIRSENLVALAVMLSGVGLLLATMWFAQRSAGLLCSDLPLAAQLTPWFVGLFYPLAYWTLRGMEVGLTALLIAAAVFLALGLRQQYTTRRLTLLAVVLALGLLTRTDMIVPVLIISIYITLATSAPHRVRVATILGLVIASTLLAHTAFRVAYYGDVVPLTYHLKIEGRTFGAVALRGWSTFAAVAGGQLRFCFVLALGFWVARPRLWRTAALLTAVVAGQIVYSIWVGGDAWEWFGYANRYLSSAAAPLLVLAAAGVAALTAPARTRSPAATIYTTVLLVALIATGLTQLPTGRLGNLAVWVVEVTAAAAIFVACASKRTTLPPRLLAYLVAGCAVVVWSGPWAYEWVTHGAQHVADDAYMTRLGDLLATTTSEDAKVAVVWAGTVPYRARRQAMDLLGKNDYHVATQAPSRSEIYPGHDHWDYDWSIGVLRPDIVLGCDGILVDLPKYLTDAGYKPVAPSVYVLTGSPNVEVSALGKGARTLGAAPC